MARRPKPKSFATPAAGGPPAKAKAPRQQAIPDAVANRMVRRIAIATGTPTVLGMGVFVASYLLVSRGLLDIPPGLTLVGSGAFFLLGLLGLSYGVLSASWEDAPAACWGSSRSASTSAECVPRCGPCARAPRAPAQTAPRGERNQALKSAEARVCTAAGASATQNWPPRRTKRVSFSCFTRATTGTRTPASSWPGR